jgi:hypothetical protein
VTTWSWPHTTRNGDGSCQRFAPVRRGNEDMTQPIVISLAETGRMQRDKNKMTDNRVHCNED